MPRFLGIDYGTKRIGLAISDPAGIIASPLEVLTHRGAPAVAAQLAIAAGADYDVDAYVVGRPLNMDGTESEQTRITRGFSRQLAEQSGRPVHEWDERLSSLGADEYLAQGDLTRKRRRARHDAVAAQIILQGFLDAQRLPPGPAAGP